MLIQCIGYVHRNHDINASERKQGKIRLLDTTGQILEPEEGLKGINTIIKYHVVVVPYN